MALVLYELTLVSLSSKETTHTLKRIMSTPGHWASCPGEGLDQPGLRRHSS